MARTAVFTVHGFKLRSASQRRYVVVAFRAEDFIRPADVMGPACTFVKFARIEKRSDSLGTAQAHARRMRDNGYRGTGLGVCVVDTVTGEEV